MFRSVVLVLVAACGFSASLPNGATGDAAPSDGQGTPDMLVGSGVCYGTFTRVCLPAAPSTPVQIAAATTIDTDTSSLCTATTGGTGAGFCVVAGSTVSVQATLRATGSKPLVLVGASTISVAARIDVASTRDAGPGAGANPVACVAGTNPTGSSGGGYGGTLRGAGGNGGNGNNASIGGVASAAVNFTSLRGGCPGANGGGGADERGDGGDGGGAIALVAGQSISLAPTGSVHASGAGGGGGEDEAAGGGGGGSGGAIVLDAPSVQLATGAVLLAQGGGGGEGAGFDDSNGNDGREPMTPGVFAAGGAGGTTQGGDGGAGATTAGASGGASGIAGGGGGGGGTGATKTTATTLMNLGSVSPPFL